MGETSIVDLLLMSAHPLDINSIFEFGETPADLASFCGHHEVVNLLISKGANIDNLKEDKKSPLVRAVEGNRGNAVRLALEHHADLRTQDQPWTPLHAYFYRDNDIVANLLLERWPRGDVDLQDSKGKSPLYNAFVWRHFEVARSFIKYHAQPDQASPRFSVFWAACLGGSFKLVLYLLVLTGVSIDEPSFKDWTPLMCACDGGYPKLAEYLLFRGMDTEARNEEG